MQWLWTWGGVSFGYREGDDLFTHDGRHVGRFHGNHVHGPDGTYVGELKKEDRLITRVGAKPPPKGAFAPVVVQHGHARHAHHAGYTMFAGYVDFPEPDTL